MSLPIVPTAGRVLGLVAFAMALSSCQHVTPIAPEGNASFRFLEPPAPPSSAAKGTITMSPHGPTFVPARPQLPLAMPVFPHVALRAAGFGTTVSVHVLVDAKGRVAEVRPSPFGFTMPSPYAKEFFAAVEQAVSQWRFQPAEMRYPNRPSLLNGHGEERSDQAIPRDRHDALRDDKRTKAEGDRHDADPVASDRGEQFRNFVRTETVETEFDVAFLFTSTGAVVFPR